MSVVGKLSAISEPMKNGPSHLMVVVRLSHVSDSSQYCHIVIQVSVCFFVEHMCMTLLCVYFCSCLVVVVVVVVCVAVPRTAAPTSSGKGF